VILRKPYAFIIKHFKLIHLIILGCLAFCIYNFGGIQGLINTLISSRTYTYSGADIYMAADGTWRYIFDHVRVPILHVKY
jgi:hypothetical protein